jgi:hypothetical protein
VRLAAHKEDSPFLKGGVAREIVGISGEQNKGDFISNVLGVF